MKIEKRNDTNLARCLTALAQAIFRRRRWFLYPQLALFVVCVLYTWQTLQFDTKRSTLVGSNKRYHQNYLAFREEFPFQDDLVVVVESEDAEKNRQFVERLGARLEAESNLFNHVFYKGDLNMLGSKALLFVPEEDLAELKRRLQAYRPFIQQFSRTTNLVSLFDMINAKFRTAPREENAENKSLINAIPVLERIVRQADACLSRPGTPLPGGYCPVQSGGRG